MKAENSRASNACPMVRNERGHAVHMRNTRLKV